MQAVIDGVETLVAMEKRLEKDEGIEDLYPSGISTPAGASRLFSCFDS